MNSISNDEYVFVMKKQIQKLKDAGYQREEIIYVLSDTSVASRN